MLTSRICKSARRLLSRVLFGVRVSFCLAVLFLTRLFYRVCGSGARGLIKAPAGSGAGPGERKLVYCSDPGCPGHLPPLWGGVGGGPHKSLLDLLVWTDTFWGVRGGYGVR